MKRLLIILIFLLPITTFSQSLMLSVSRSVVKYEMSKENDWELIVNNKNLLTYQKSDTLIDFLFTHRLCDIIYITIPHEKVYEYIKEKETNWCWETTGSNTWTYDPKVFDSPILIKMTTFGTFKYTLEFLYDE